jgi:hypothetical protein
MKKAARFKLHQYADSVSSLAILALVIAVLNNIVKPGLRPA